MKPSIKHLLLVILLTAVLNACVPSKSTAIQINDPYAPQASDGTLVRETVEIVKTELVNQNIAQHQVALRISLFTPTPCHQFRIDVGQPGQDKRINIDVYSLRKQNQVCTLMRLNTPTEADLNLGSLPIGHYSIWVNGDKALEFDA
jgi:hypothetical protein